MPQPRLNLTDRHPGFVVTRGSRFPPAMQIELIPGCQLRPPCDRLASPEKVVLESALSVGKQKRTRGPAFAESPECRHVNGRERHPAPVLSLPGTFAL